MPYKDPEKERECQRAYKKTPQGIKSTRISRWTWRGIKCSDWDAMYERYLNTTNCETCDVLLTTGLGRTGKCLDHDHSIDDRENVRAILCGACNVNDKSTNTSGVPNVYYYKYRNRWLYQRMVNGIIIRKTFKTKQEAIRYKYEFELDLEASFECLNSPGK